MSLFAVADQVIENECSRLGLRPEALMSPSHTRSITTARQNIIRRLRQETHMSWREIAEVVGSHGSGKSIMTKRL